MSISWDGYSATFAAPYVAPEVEPDKATKDEMVRVSLNEDERTELAQLRAARTMYAELGLADED